MAPRRLPNPEHRACVPPAYDFIRMDESWACRLPPRRLRNPGHPAWLPAALGFLPFGRSWGIRLSSRLLMISSVWANLVSTDGIRATFETQSIQSAFGV